MIRALYSLLTWLVQPLLRRKLARRAVAEPGYAVAVEERFGHYTVPPDQGRGLDARGLAGRDARGGDSAGSDCASRCPGCACC